MLPEFVRVRMPLVEGLPGGDVIVSVAKDPIRVLVVDDEQGLRALARQALGLAGFGVSGACDGMEALEVLKERGADLVLLDVDMPGLNGFEVCARIRETPGHRGTPILIMTGLDDSDSVNRAYEAGATDFVVKPLNWVVLGHRVRHMVRASRATEELRRSEEKLATAQRMANLGWWEWDVARNVFSASDQFFRIFGLDGSGFGSTFETFLRCVHREDREAVRSAFEEALRRLGSISVDHRVLRSDGVQRIVHEHGRVSADGAGAPSRVSGTVQDVTERKEIEEQIRCLAYFDGLTGLPNRRLFQERLALALEAARRHGRIAALLFLDLDRFKRINDTMGHSVGDTLLREAGERISQCLRRTDCVTRPQENDSEFLIARLGGDEFIVLLSEIARVQDAARVARRVIKALARPFLLGEQEIFISGSIGIAIYPFDGEDAETLLKNADTAMYHAKDQGRNNYQFYTESMNATAFERLVLEGSLRRALERGEFILHYQPQLCLSSNRIIGAEALVRWEHPELGSVPPSDFIPLAEESGLIVPLGSWVLRAACAQGRLWHEAGRSDLRIAVNVSSRQFGAPGFAETVSLVLEETRIDPTRLDLEITETSVMQDAEENRKILKRLKDLGIRVSVDDFGTGYSSLSYLRRLPLDALKVDRSFLAGVPTDEDRTTITTAIIALGRSLNLTVVAEGVETEEQLRFLREKGCHEAQGYWIGRPAPAEAFSASLHRPSVAPDLEGD